MGLSQEMFLSSERADFISKSVTTSGELVEVFLKAIG